MNAQHRTSNVEHRRTVHLSTLLLKTLSQKTRNFFYRSVDRHQIQIYGIFDAGSFFVFWVAGITRLRCFNFI